MYAPDMFFLALSGYFELFLAICLASVNAWSISDVSEKYPIYLDNCT